MRSPQGGSFTPTAAVRSGPGCGPWWGRWWFGTGAPQPLPTAPHPETWKYRHCHPYAQSTGVQSPLTLTPYFSQRVSPSTTLPRSVDLSTNLPVHTLFVVLYHSTWESLFKWYTETGYISPLTIIHLPVYSSYPCYIITCINPPSLWYIHMYISLLPIVKLPIHPLSPLYHHLCNAPLSHCDTSTCIFLLCLLCNYLCLYSHCYTTMYQFLLHC